jgi:hypothetical protein
LAVVSSEVARLTIVEAWKPGRRRLWWWPSY